MCEKNQTHKKKLSSLTTDTRDTVRRPQGEKRKSPKGEKASQLRRVELNLEQGAPSALRELSEGKKGSGSKKRRAFFFEEGGAVI